MKKKALVLRSGYPETPYVVLLDSQQGRNECWIKSKRIGIQLCQGALITYDDIHLHNNILDATHVEILHVPFSMAATNIYFLHHILELCDRLIPEGSQSAELFELIEISYLSLTMLSHRFYIKIFLLKFYAILGLLQEDSSYTLTALYRLLSVPIDNMATLKIELEDERLLDIILDSCLQQCPIVAEMKTNNFLNMVRTP